MGSIDNILGKVDTLMKKTDRFLEEHLPEEPPIDYEKEGVNRKQIRTEWRISILGKLV